MTPEEIYDAEIAPKLLELAKRCQELGFPFIAQVEWENGETGRTEFCPGFKDDQSKRPSSKQLLAHMAVRCEGNVDKLLIWLLRDADTHGHSSMFLRQLGCDNIKYTGNEMAAFTVTMPKETTR